MKLKYFAPVVVWALVIILATTLPANSFPQVFNWGAKNLDKLIHFLVFGVFGVLLALAFFKQHYESYLHRNRLWLSVVVGFVFGVITEGAQHFFIPSRSGELIDIVANLFGTVFGVFYLSVIAALIEKISPKKL